MQAGIECNHVIDRGSGKVKDSRRQAPQVSLYTGMGAYAESFNFLHNRTLMGIQWHSHPLMHYEKMKYGPHAVQLSIQVHANNSQPYKLP